MRQSGILLHITSLPSPGYVGTLGACARQFVDFLRDSGMTVWQVLPIGPTGYGESPYQSASTFAGNPLLIDEGELVAAGYLEAALPPEDVENPELVDYERARRRSEKMLRVAFERDRTRSAELAREFKQRHAWADDYALFAAIKRHFGDISWMKWPDQALRRREKAALDKYRALLSDEIEYHLFVQALFFEQWAALKNYANMRGIKLFGDMPIYVAEDSADLWANPEGFQLDENLTPTRVAGVPPDYFSEDGQLWGNPLYDWKAMKKREFDWWIERLRAAGEMFDMLRVDHFIGFANYYSIPYGAKNARVGMWVYGPGKKFFQVVRKKLPKLCVIAEDLGVVSEHVIHVKRYCGYPGMKILCFGFDTDLSDPGLPDNYPENCVAYTGTHDNDTLLGWWAKATDEQKALAREALHFETDGEVREAFISALFGSRANTVIVPMQDALGLDGHARMNLPGTIGNNWLWRMREGAADKELSNWLKELNRKTARGK